MTKTEVKTARKFKLDMKANSIGTSGQGSVEVSYQDLEDAFGVPEDSDNYKVSGEWTFTDKDGNVYTLYDWKETNLYDGEYPSVEKFRNQDSAEFHTGGTDEQRDVEFRAWIVDEVKKAKNKPPHKNSKAMRRGQAVERLRGLNKKREAIQEHIGELDAQMAEVDAEISTLSRTYDIRDN